MFNSNNNFYIDSFKVALTDRWTGFSVGRTDWVTGVSYPHLSTD